MSLWRWLRSRNPWSGSGGVSATNHSLAAGRDLTVILAGPTASSRFRGKIKSFLEEYLVSETGPVPFGGRDEQLARLDDWLANKEAAPRLLVTAPAGRGKSALLVHWIESLHARGLATGDEAGWHIIFVPVSIRIGTNAPNVFYQALATRLADIQGETLPAPTLDADAYYAERASSQLRSLGTERPETRVLIVFDGVDEALGGRFDSAFFPRDPGPNLKMVVSARLQAGDIDASGWLRRLSWNQGVRAESFEVPALDAEQVADVLVKMGAPVDVLGARRPVVERLAELTEGEPLLLRFYAEDLWQRREEVAHIRLGDLDALRPGFGAYFERWLELQRQAWSAEGVAVDDTTIDGILAVLGCALGPLQRDDLARLAHQVHGAPSMLSTPQLLRPLRRFIVGRGSVDSGYVLSHPKIGQWLREEYLDASAVRTTLQGFANWGREVIEGLRNGHIQTEQTPGYLLQFYATHLLATDAPADDFMAFVNNSWCRAWEHYEGGYTGFAGDVRTALQKVGAAWLDDPNLQRVLEWRILCVLCLSSIQAIGRNTPVELLALALDEGLISVKQVMNIIAMRADSEAQPVAVIAHHLTDDLWDDAVAEVLRIENTLNRAQQLIRIAARASGERRKEIAAFALRDIESLSDRYDRASLLVELAPSLEGEDRLKATGEALESARSVEKPQEKAILLGNLSVLLSDPANETDRKAVLGMALEAAAEVHEPLARASILVDLAPKLLPDDRAIQLEKTLKIVEPFFLEVANTRIPRHEDHLQDDRIESIYRVYLAIRTVRATDMEQAAGQREIDEVIAATQHFRDPYRQVELLLQLACRSSPSSWPRFVTICFAKTKLLQTGNNRTHALTNLAPLASHPERTEIITEGLHSAKLIEDEWGRAGAMIDLLAHLSPDDRAGDLQMVIDAVNAIGYVLHRGEAFVKLAPLLSPRDSEVAFRLGIQLIKKVTYRFFRIGSLINQLGHLPLMVQKEVFNTMFEEAINSPVFRELFLAQLVREGGHLWQMRHFDDALQVAEGTESPSDRTRLLCALASIASRLDRNEVVDQALEAALGLEDLNRRVECLAGLVPLLQRDRAEQILEQARMDALQIGDALHRCSALAEVLPILCGEQRQEALQEARNAADRLSDEQRARQLRIIARYHAPDERSEAIRSAFASLTPIADHQKRVEVLAELACEMPTPDERLAALDCLIESSSHLPRTSFLSNLGRVAPLVAEFGGAHVARTAIRMIAETARWWP